MSQMDDDYRRDMQNKRLLDDVVRSVDALLKDYDRSVPLKTEYFAAHLLEDCKNMSDHIVRVWD